MLYTLVNIRKSKFSLEAERSFFIIMNMIIIIIILPGVLKTGLVNIL